MGDRQGLPMQRPPPHRHHERDGIDKATRIEIQQLMNCVGDLDIGNLHNERWQCKFLLMVLQYCELCLSCRVAKSASLHFKLCLYIAYDVLTYFREFPVCI